MNLSYSKFKKRVEKTVDLTKFVEKVEQIIVYVKMVGTRSKISHSIVFNWLAMINDDSNFEPYEIEREVLRNIDDVSSFSETDLEIVLKKLYSVHEIFEQIVEDFEDKKKYIISLNFDENTRRADLSIYKNEREYGVDFSILEEFGYFERRK